MADGEKAATAYTIGWGPQKGPQTALLACPVFEVFFGGARGGGKTDGMLGEWASHADLHGKNAVGLMVRRERVQLLETARERAQLLDIHPRVAVPLVSVRVRVALEISKAQSRSVRPAPHLVLIVVSRPDRPIDLPASLDRPRRF